MLLWCISYLKQDIKKNPQPNPQNHPTPKQPTKNPKHLKTKYSVGQMASAAGKTPMTEGMQIIWRGFEVM